jgi:hypothetical protein
MAGKGDAWRKGTDYKKYYNSSYWAKLEEKKQKNVNKKKDTEK